MTDENTETQTASDGGQSSERSELDDELVQSINETVSELVRRTAVAQAMGDSWGYLDDREYFETLGYPDRSELNINDYWAKYERGGIGESIIDIPAGSTWLGIPDISDDGSSDPDDELSDFERDVQSVFDDTGALTYLERADTLQRIGRYGILLIGFNDGGDLDDQVDPSKLSGDPADDILYYQAFSEKHIDDFERVDDTQDERFGQPKTYEVDFGNDHPLDTETVHHSRVIHLAEGALEDDVIGHSAFRPIFNYLIDLIKVVGGSAEMFWRDAKARYVANLDPDAGRTPDEDKIGTQVEEMANDLRDVVWGRGLELDRIEGSSPDPSGLKDSIIELLAGNIRIPKRRLLGTERGDLASTQDEAAFISYIDERRQKYAEPQELRPFIEMLVEYGIVSSPKDESYDVDWPDNFELTELERAELVQRLAKAVKDASSMGDPAELATTEERRREIFDWSPERGSEVDIEPVPDDGADGGTDDATDTDVDVDDLDDDLDEDDPQVDEWFEETFGSNQPS